MNFKQLKKGDVLSETQFYTVEAINADKVQLKNDQGTNIVVDKNYAESCLLSANQFTKDVTVNKTEAAAKFLANPDVAITVNFNKQVKEADVVKEIMDTYGNSTPKEFETKLKKTIKTGLVGEARTMVGRHNGELNDLGRVNFIDMEEKRDASKDYDTRTRLVDPRGINWFIVKGIKYIVK
jgi:hypothetical protein